ncbi:response regulator [Sphingopyxis sp.]|uniref:response regulator n=1 Tax=Sphingopyxis sp. TaxID=1908224 RepID=UPI003D0A09A9
MTIRVFLVEDDPLVAMMLEGYLDVFGHKIVATAATVAEALDLVAKRDFDLAIFDVHLADGKTSEPVAAALSDAGKAFIVTSGDATILAAEFNGRPVLRKPFRIAELERAIATITG